MNINEKIAFSAGFDVFFFGAKIKGRSSNFSGLLGRSRECSRLNTADLEKNISKHRKRTICIPSFLNS